MEFSQRIQCLAGQTPVWPSVVSSRRNGATICETLRGQRLLRINVRFGRNKWLPSSFGDALRNLPSTLCMKRTCNMSACMPSPNLRSQHSIPTGSSIAAAHTHTKLHNNVPGSLQVVERTRIKMWWPNFW